MLRTQNQSEHIRNCLRGANPLRGAQDKGYYMGNLERLTTNKRDLVLLQFIIDNGAQELTETNTNFNRGDFFEMALTKERVKRNGLHEISKGDFIFNGEIVEIKYLTKKTGASKDKQGTRANYYLIGFNNGETIELRLIKKCDLVTRHDGTREKITFQDNINKGVRVEL